ncbi:MAG TPA: aspartyl protease family protein [Candidatus Binatia bacterium]
MRAPRPLLTACLVTIALTGHAAPAAAASVTVRAATDATLLPPMIALHLRDGAGRALKPVDAGEAELMGDLPVLAILDTGASATLLSHDTAQRYGVRSESGARWTETGMTGDHALGVTAAYGLALDAGGDEDGGRGRRAAPSPIVLDGQRLLVNDVAATPEAMLASPGAIVDVVGMPALQRAVAELHPAGGGLAPASVTLHEAGDAVRADHWLPLALVDFARHHDPKNRGTPPTLAPNPVLRGVRVVEGGHSARGDWLVDTGSALTILSTATARSLGLHEPAPLSAPVGGISGTQQALPGWHVERVEIPTSDGDVLVLTDAAVFVHDVTTVTDDGTRITLDGIFGANQLEAFSRVVIDVPHARLGVDLRP